MAQYPGAAATDASQYIAVNQLSTALSSNIDGVVTTIPVVSTAGFPVVGFVSIDLEVIAYTNTDATHFLSCTRGSDGTSAAAHVSPVTVSHNIVAAHHNANKEEIKAIEADLVAVQSSLTPTLPANTASNILNRINQIVHRLRALGGLTNWYDTFVSVPVTSGGTGNTSFTSGNYIKGAGSSALTTQATPIPISDGGTNSAAAVTNNRTLVVSAGAIVSNPNSPTASSVMTTDSNGVPNTSSGTMQGNLSFSNTATQGIVGTTSNNNGATGNVGENTRGQLAAGSAVGDGGDNVYFDITSFSITAGDWDVSGIASFTLNGATAGNYVLYGVSVGNSGSSFADAAGGDNQGQMAPPTANTDVTGTIPTFRVAINSTTTIYLKGLVRKSAGTIKAYGRISARRVR